MLRDLGSFFCRTAARKSLSRSRRPVAIRAVELGVLLPREIGVEAALERFAASRGRRRVAGGSSAASS
jgi:hypothetical protein